MQKAIIVMGIIIVFLVFFLALSIRHMICQSGNITELNANIDQLESDIKAQKIRCDELTNSIIESHKRVVEVRNETQKAIESDPVWSESIVPDDVKRVCENLCNASGSRLSKDAM